MFLLVLACTAKTPSDGDTSGETGQDETAVDSGDSAESDSGGKDSETDTGGETGGDTGAETDDSSPSDEDTAVMPDDPRPLTLHVSGSYQGTLVFDEPSCSWYDGVPNFRAFWRNAAKDHVFVLVAEILGPFTGPGTYDQTMTTTRIKLQEEAGGAGNYFGTDTAQGDTATITVEHLSTTRAWGEFSFNALHGEGSVTVDPQPIPIWCPELM